MVKELFREGHTACAGCGEAIAVKIALQILGENTIIVMPPNCLSVFTILPFSNLAVPATLTPFASTGAMLSGIKEAFELKGESVNVVGFAGDGGTADIGLQSLSGCIERGHKVIYFNLNNQAYMNTGCQRSSMTPSNVKTAYKTNSKRNQKNIFDIVCAHKKVYAATASIGYMQDYITKIKKAMNTDLPSYIEVLVPCPSAWGFASSNTIKIAKLAVDSGNYDLMEFENGEKKINKSQIVKGDVEYRSMQKRYLK